MEVLSVVTYCLNLPPTWQIHNAFHALTHSLYYKMREYRVNYTKPPPNLIDREPEWEVEQILASWHIGRLCQLQYLIK